MQDPDKCHQTGREASPITASIDPKQCQVEMRSFMTLGPGFNRCVNKPTTILTEREPGEDGRHGSMSICDECLGAYNKQGGNAFVWKLVAEVKTVKVKTKRAPARRDLPVIDVLQWQDKGALPSLMEDGKRVGGYREAILGDWDARDGVRFTLQFTPTCHRRGRWKLLIETVGAGWGCFDEQDQPVRWYHDEACALKEAQALADVLLAEKR